MKYDLPPSLVVLGNGPVRVLKLNRPEQRNAVDYDMHVGLGHVWDQLANDPAVHAVILTGEGRGFCAGGDMGLLERAAGDPADRHRVVAHARRIVTEIVAFPLPVIAAVNGPAIGLGCSLALLCDIVLMSDQTYLADPHVSIGVVAADGAALCWPLLASLQKAKEYLLTGDRIDAATAERIGLVNRVVPADQLMPEAEKLASRLAAQPARALRDTKRALNIHLREAVANVADFAFAAESETFALPELQTSLGEYRRAAGLT